MRHKGMVMQAVIGAMLLLTIFARDSHAYLDPGTGSFILQLILAGLFAVLLSVRIFWGKLKAFFTRLYSPEPTEKEKGIDEWRCHPGVLS